eukprot:TRINITY_DN29244_c0_g2_i1.p1 TRINITY_DN29244_c0_g2~~TRINITY_DN29244_c0_g2_i1.p1  ORF type:complete len:518 (+),score=38.55 TRINITY_DN29244_c0_g2_i1:66-1619(+)
MNFLQGQSRSREAAEGYTPGHVLTTEHEIDKGTAAQHFEMGKPRTSALFRVGVSKGADVEEFMTSSQSLIDQLSTYYILQRLLVCMIAASVVAILPVVMPLGDWTDISPSGYLHQLGYFVWYTGTGWATLWTVWAMWASRILERPVPIWTTIVLPTLFAIVLFFCCHVLLGGPFPLGTLSLGVFCFAFEFLCLWHFFLKEDECGLRLLTTYMAWLGLLFVYFGLTIVMKRVPGIGDSLAALFPFLGEMCARFNLERYIFKNGQAHPDQKFAAGLFKLNYVTLHVTYSNFLFPVLADMRSVMTSAVIGLLLQVEELYRSLGHLNTEQWRGREAANELSSVLSDKAYILCGKLVAPLLFAFVLSFEEYSFNHGMFYTFDTMTTAQLQQCFICMAVTFIGALVSIVLCVTHFRWWMTVNMDDGEGGSLVQGDDGVAFNINHYTVVRTLRLVKERTVDRLSDFQTLLWMTFGANTTIVGVCMVMKHDGMDIDGWTSYLLDGAGMPYPLCPMWATGCSRAFH